MNSIISGFLMISGLGSSITISGHSGNFDVMTLLVFFASAVGTVALFYSWLVELGREKSHFKDLENQYGLNEKGKSTKVMDHVALESLLNDNEGAMRNTLVGRRIENILLALSREKRGDDEGRDSEGTSGNRKAVAPPQMQDLHRMTQQLINSRLAPTMVRVVVSVLLIMGICGTLWGVHDALGYKYDLLRHMPRALEPSKFAVLFTVILAGLRGFYNASVEKFIWKIDRLTMMHILPDLMPASDINLALSEFTKTVSTLSKRLDGIGTDSLENATKSFHYAVSSFSDAARGFTDYVEEHKQKTADTHQRLEEELKDSRDTTTKMGEQLTAIAERQIRTQQAAESLSSDMENIHTMLNQLRDAAQFVKSFTTETAKLQGDVADVIAECDKGRTILTSFQETGVRLSQSVGSFSDTAAELKSQVDSYSDNTEKLQNTAKRAEQSVAKTHLLADSVSTEVERLSVQVQESSKKHKELQSMCEKATNELLDINNRFKQEVESINVTFKKARDKREKRGGTSKRNSRR